MRTPVNCQKCRVQIRIIVVEPRRTRFHMAFSIRRRAGIIRQIKTENLPQFGVCRLSGKRRKQASGPQFIRLQQLARSMSTLAERRAGNAGLSARRGWRWNAGYRGGRIDG
jgi:hypothetical protein